MDFGVLRNYDHTAPYRGRNWAKSKQVNLQVKKSPFAANFRGFRNAFCCEVPCGISDPQSTRIGVLRKWAKIGISDLKIDLFHFARFWPSAEGLHDHNWRIENAVRKDVWKKLVLWRDFTGLLSSLRKRWAIFWVWRLFLLDEVIVQLDQALSKRVSNNLYGFHIMLIWVKGPKRPWNPLYVFFFWWLAQTFQRPLQMVGCVATKFPQIWFVCFAKSPQILDMVTWLLRALDVPIP